MEYRILGPLEVSSDGGGRVALQGAKQRALLAVLLLRRGEVVPTDQLLDELYGDDLPAAATKTIQVHVSRLRRALGDDAIRTHPGGYALHVGREDVDRDEFERLAAEGCERLAGGDAAGAHASLGSALALWRGPPLCDFAYEPFAQREIARLEELRVGAVEDRVEAELLLGRHGAVIAELETLVASEPLRERLWRLLMLALYRSGRQADALAAFARARVTLDELGIEPSRNLRELEAAILRHDPSLDVARPGRRAAGVFVGRERELAQLLAGLDDAVAGRGRLFVVSGESGMGKTRLADELASRAKERGVAIRWGRAVAAGAAPPYVPWRHALRGVAEIAADEPPFALAEQVVDQLRAAPPTLLVLEDVHAADEASLELLTFVAGELAELPVLLVATFQEGHVPAQLRALADRTAHHHLRLRPLSPVDVAELAARLGVEADAARVHAETEGIPRAVWRLQR